jgi:HK97 family phage major capsid protein
MSDTHSIEVDSLIHVRDAAKRELDVRIMPWERVISTISGQEMFVRGAFADTDPSQVRLMGFEHEAHLGLGQDGKPVLTRIPVGKGLSLDDRDDGAYMTFRVAKTVRGDEVLALADEGIAAGISAEFTEIPGGTTTEVRDGRRTRVHRRVRLMGASTTYRPAYEEAAVLAVRTEGETTVPETTNAAEPAPAIDITALTGSFADSVKGSIEEAMTTVSARTASADAVAQILERMDAMEERSRAQFSIPAKNPEQAHPDDFGRGDWLKIVLRTLSGDTVSQAELQARVTAELITTDNLGVVPPAYLSEIIGIIDPSRPFLSSTRQLTTPRSGMQLTVPVISTRPTVGVQAAEKDDLASTTTSITSTNYNPITVGGYGDISIQLLKRSDPSYLEMYVDLLAEAYAVMADDKAVDALLAAVGIQTGTTFDPDDGAQFGEAWQNAAEVSRRLVPDTVWLSSSAVARFIDARSDTTNAPLYANLAANFTAAGGPGGTISGLRPVHVPALDDETYDVIVGPSRGFAWAEDGTYTLQVDVPAKAGRDVGLVGMLWFAPLYPAAFTRFALTGS